MKDLGLGLLLARSELPLLVDLAQYKEPAIKNSECGTTWW